MSCLLVVNSRSRMHAKKSFNVEISILLPFYKEISIFLPAPGILFVHKKSGQ
jgi:hypothetical protein